MWSIKVSVSWHNMLRLQQEETPCKKLFWEVKEGWDKGHWVWLFRFRFGKQATLSEVFTLVSIEGAKMEKMRMSDILEGPSLTFNCQLAVNELTLNVTVLLNTDAEGEAFIHKRHLNFVIKQFQLYVRIAQRPVLLADYNNQNSEMISRAFTANLMIEGRWILTHFLFCNTGRHDILIERKWFEKTKVLIDCCNRKLIWSEET